MYDICNTGGHVCATAATSGEGAATNSEVVTATTSGEVAATTSEEGKEGCLQVQSQTADKGEEIV